jgi:2-C-methyl-D-erythritol 4-phosphate cytidylyltransferase
MRYWLVMPAAGAGRRFGGQYPKQHAMLAGSTVLETSLRIFVADDRCRGVALALAGDDLRRAALSQRLPARVRVVTGGAQRSESVLLGLEALTAVADERDWVLVHDAVRPCLSIGDLDRLLTLGDATEQGALLAVPVADTLKQQDAAGRSFHTVARDGLWRALTPQMFRYGRLRAALQQARHAMLEPTDEAQAVEWLGDKPLLVAAADSNIKITTAEDLAVAAAVLAGRR